MHRLWMALGLMAGLSGGRVLADPPPEPAYPPNPFWLIGPGPADIQAAYPERARSLRVEGVATMSCGVSVIGALENCAVVKEDPPEWGFGAAALSLAPQIRMRTATVGGASVSGGVVVASIRFARDYGATPPEGGVEPAWAVKTVPGWFVRPSDADVQWAYPPRAQRMGISGFVVLRCVISAIGAAEDCSVLREQPADQGFAAAAFKLVPRFKFRPMTFDGRAVGGALVNIPVRFAVP